MMLSVPAAAASRVRATGASENSIPAAASPTPTTRASATLVVLRSTTISPRLPVPAIPSLPKQTSLTCLPPGSRKKDDVGGRGHFCDGMGRSSALSSIVAHHSQVEVEGVHRSRVLPDHVAAHRRTHNAEADEADGWSFGLHWLRPSKMPPLTSHVHRAV